MNISTVCTIGKSLAIKREKDDDAAITRAHLRFTDLFLTREQVTTLCGQRPGWCETAFFDELGAPLGKWSLALLETERSIVGTITGPNGHGLRFADASLSRIEITMTELGAVVAGEIAWTVTGDEAGDAEPLLGRECRAEWQITDGGQRDFLRGEAA